MSIPPSYPFVNEICTLETSLPGEFLACNILHDLGDSQKGRSVDYFNCFLVASGTGLYEDAHGRKYPLRRGSVVYNLPGKAHSVCRDQPGWLQFGVSLPESWFYCWRQMGVICCDSSVISYGLNREILDGFVRLHRRLARTDSSSLPVFLRDLQSWFLTLDDLRKADSDGGDHSVLEKGRCLLISRCSESLSPEELLCNLPMSYSHFRRLFKESTGLSPGKFRDRHRMARAKYLLRDSSLSIKEIASQLGYADVYGFSKAFKRHEGHSPGRYRDGVIRRSVLPGSG